MREAKNFTLEQLSEKTGFEVEQLEKLEAIKDPTKAKKSFLKKVCGELEINPVALIFNSLENTNRYSC